MKTFLEYVAEDIVGKYGTRLGRVAIVFPGKRTSLFLNDHLLKAADKASKNGVKGESGNKKSPIWSPVYLTISELFCKQSSLAVENEIKLVCELYKACKKLSCSDESIEHFYSWGQCMLADFDDIDKHMADARQVYSNLRDLHSIDSIEYLSGEQRHILKRFFHNFSVDHDSELRRRFLHLWNQLGTIYTTYKEQLHSQHIAYEGMLYRDVVESSDIFLPYDVYLFVGFNLLQRVEQTLFSRIMKAGKARFYWDFDDYYIHHHNEAGHYIRQYLNLFPNELDSKDGNIFDNLRQPKQLTYISSPTEDLEARYVSTWLTSNGRADAGRRSAVVLCNEAMLPTVVHSIPPSVGKVNVTGGFPLSQSPVYTLINSLISLHSDGYIPARSAFRLRYVLKVLNHPYSSFISPHCPALSKHLSEDNIFYPTPSDLAEDSNLRDLFTPTGEPVALLAQLKSTIQRIALGCPHGGDQFMQESLFRIYTSLNSLDQVVADEEIRITIPTLQRLLRQIVRSTTVTFHGEPATGLQVMGVLETRNLDFDHILILSCNEGYMPAHTSDNSFIPYFVRKAYGLTTPDNQVDIYSYYFHRMLQRAHDVTIVYNNTPTNRHTGEMSRFMLQLLAESPLTISRKTLRAAQQITRHAPNAVDKKPSMFTRFLNQPLSPSAINCYIRCQLQFYYQYIIGIRQPDKIDIDNIDSRLFGNLFHHAAQLLYDLPDTTITKATIERLSDDQIRLERIVDRSFREELLGLQPGDRRHVTPSGMQIICRRVILNYLKRLLKIDKSLSPFTLLGSEKDVQQPIDITTSAGLIRLSVGGRIDRLDEIISDTASGECYLRVVDYKTGAKLFKNNLKNINEIFHSPDPAGKHTDYYLQALLYAMIVSGDRELNPHSLSVKPALLFIQHMGGENYDPTLQIDGEEVIVDTLSIAEFKRQLTDLITEMFEPSTQFVPTSNNKICITCPYRFLCG